MVLILKEKRLQRTFKFDHLHTHTYPFGRGRCALLLLIHSVGFVVRMNECDESNIQHEMTKTNAHFGDDLPESFVRMDSFQYFSFVMAIGYSLSACVSI